MGYAIQLHFDDSNTKKITTLTAQLHTTYGGLDLTGINAAPHISLAVFDTLVPERVERLLADFAAATARFALALAAVGSFPGPKSVVYLAPVVTADLLAVHTELHAQLRVVGLQSHGYYRPGSWVPHCTVAMELPKEHVAKAVADCRAANVFNTVQIESVELVKFRPVEGIYHHPLRKS